MAHTIEIIARFSAQLKTLAALSFMGAFLFFLIANLSTPVIKSLYIMQMTNIAEPEKYIRWGVFGICLSPTDQIDHVQQQINSLCTPNQLGYGDVSDYFNAIGAPAYLTNIQPGGLEIVYLFHPLGTGIAFVTAILSLLTGLKELPIVCLLIGFLSSGASAFAFSSDIAYVVQSRINLRNYGYDSTFRIDWGMGVWLEFIGFLMSYGGMIFLFAACCFGDRTKKTAVAR
jgi:hypothetical protein